MAERLLNHELAAVLGEGNVAGTVETELARDVGTGPPECALAGLGVDHEDSRRNRVGIQDAVGIGPEHLKCYLRAVGRCGELTVEQPFQLAALDEGRSSGLAAFRDFEPVDDRFPERDLLTGRSWFLRPDQAGHEERAGPGRGDPVAALTLRQGLAYHGGHHPSSPAPHHDRHSWPVVKFLRHVVLGRSRRHLGAAAPLWPAGGREGGQGRPKPYRDNGEADDAHLSNSALYRAPTDRAETC